MVGVLSPVGMAAALSFDSLLAGAIAAPWLRATRLRAAFVLSCGFCDGAASLAGGYLPAIEFADAAHWLLYLACALAVLRAASANPRWLFAVPAALALDNLFAAAPPASAGALALASAAMSAAGLALGEFALVAARRALLIARATA